MKDQEIFTFQFGDFTIYIIFVQSGSNNLFTFQFGDFTIKDTTD